MDEIVRLAEAKKVPPCTIVIFGASGDLAMRKLIPALYSLDSCGERLLADETMIVGCARRQIAVEEFRHHARDAVRRFSNAPLQESCWERFAARLDYLSGVETRDSFYRLKERLDQAGLIEPPDGRGFSRVVVEKPIGVDLRSATAINQGLHQYLDESQIFRIDHYL